MPQLEKLGTVQMHLVEVSPFECRGELLIFESVRPRTPDNTRGGRHYLRIRRLADGTRDARDAAEFQAGEVLTEFGEGFTFGVPFAADDRVFVYATRADKDGLAQDDIHLFESSDLKTWRQSIAIRGVGELLFNCSVCRDADRYVMAYETNDPHWPAFTIKFATSDDLRTWTKLPVDQAIYGADRYTACPSIRWIDGFYYMWYLERPTAAWWFETWLTRSQDLLHWEDCPANPILRADPGEDINNSDIDFAEWRGETVIYYSWGSQQGEERLAHARFPGTLRDWVRACYEA